MKYVGIDFHKSYSFITEMDDTGSIQHQIKLSNNHDMLKGYVDRLPPQTKIAIEATKAAEKVGNVFTNKSKTMCDNR